MTKSVGAYARVLKRKAESGWMDIRTVMTLPSCPANIMEFRENIVAQALCWFSNDKFARIMEKFVL